MRRAVLALSALAVVAGGCSMHMPAMPTMLHREAEASPYRSVYRAAIADAARPAADTARDEARHPLEMLDFIGLAPGAKIADVRFGGGYFTRLFARTVGDEGRVYAFAPTQTTSRGPREQQAGEALVAAYPNVRYVNNSLEDLTFPEPLDAIWISQEYHDFHLSFFGPADMARVNGAAYRALKPGGVLVILDHRADAGTDDAGIARLHRIDPAVVRREAEAAGFVFDGESTILANPGDDHSKNVFDESIRGHTDQFVYRFRKPAR